MKRTPEKRKVAGSIPALATMREPAGDGGLFCVGRRSEGQSDSDQCEYREHGQCQVVEHGDEL
ncbi:hypothetical protein RA988_22895, partial [Mycobacteroides abscessus subsp. massiliense]